MGDSIDTKPIETGLRDSREQAEAEERRMQALLSRFKTRPQTVEVWIAPIIDEPLTLPTETTSPQPSARTVDPPSPTLDVSPTPTPTGGTAPTPTGGTPITPTPTGGSPPTPTSAATTSLAEPITAQGKREGYPKAEEFGALLGETEKLCPALTQHLSDVMSKKRIVMKGFPRKPYEEALTFVFSEKVEAPVFDASTARIALPIYKKGSKPEEPVGPEQPVKPREPADPLDLVDGLIFETCNMEMLDTFDTLSKNKIKAITPPKGEVAPDPSFSLAAYGREKSDAEAKSTLKDCELKLEMLKSGTPLAPQGKRNLASLFGTLMEQRGKPIAGLDAIIESAEQLDKLMVERKDEIIESFSLLKQGEIPLESIFALMATTPHKKTANEDETGSLPTQEMYQYEEVEEQQPKMSLSTLMGDLKGAGIPDDKLRELSPMLQRLIGKFDLPGNRDSLDANAKVARIKYLAKAQTLLKQKAGAIQFPGMEFSPKMLELAEKRVASEKRRFPIPWGLKDGVSEFETAAQTALDEFGRELDVLFPRAL